MHLHKEVEALKGASRAAVIRRIDSGDVTIYAVAQNLRFTPKQIKATFDDLVAKSQAGKIKRGFEWRRIDQHRGCPNMGIFRVDTPALVKTLRPDTKIAYAATPEHDDALTVAYAAIRRHEARGRRGERLPWETPEEFALRTKHRQRSWPIPEPIPNHAGGAQR